MTEREGGERLAMEASLFSENTGRAGVVMEATPSLSARNAFSYNTFIWSDDISGEKDGVKPSLEECFALKSNCAFGLE